MFIVNVAPTQWNRHGQLAENIENEFIGEAVNPTDRIDEISGEACRIEPISERWTGRIRQVQSVNGVISDPRHWLHSQRRWGIEEETVV